MLELGCAGVCLSASMAVTLPLYYSKNIRLFYFTTTQIEIFLKSFLPTVHENNLNSLWAHEDQWSCNCLLNATVIPDSPRAFFHYILLFFSVFMLLFTSGSL
jgi:hypothetical protein